jgi:phosphoribosylformylglycinamidine synthase
MKVSIIVFPGSNCEHDAEYVYSQLLGCNTKLVWHRENDLGKPDVVVLPGGFSYGDYLRTGAMAKLSPAMKEVSKFAQDGGPLIGICNGFQILCEAGLLPGVLLRNIKRKFLSQFVSLSVENTETCFTKNFKKGDVITCPIAHGEGNYFTTPENLKELEDNGQIVFKYKENPNGSLKDIAGICNKQRNVVGLMPHPERAAEAKVGWIGSASGLEVLRSVLN